MNYIYWKVMCTYLIRSEQYLRMSQDPSYSNIFAWHQLSRVDGEMC